MKRPDWDQQRFEVLKAVRTAVRLKHSLAADRELNEVIPEVEARIDQALREGTALELDPADFMRDVGDDETAA